jgi:hypothetical protein
MVVFAEVARNSRIHGYLHANWLRIERPRQPLSVSHDWGANRMDVIKQALRLFQTFCQTGRVSDVRRRKETALMKFLRTAVGCARACGIRDKVDVAHLDGNDA